MPDDITNMLYYGDNLDILRRLRPGRVGRPRLPRPAVQLATATTTCIFKDESGDKSDAQIVAFEDTWHWGPDAERQLRAT